MPKILIADDDRYHAEWLVTLLERARYDAASVWSGPDTLRAIAEAQQADPAQLLLTDLFMPEPDGLEILRFARECLPHMPVIGMSGRSGPLLRAMKALGAEMVFRKPLDGAALLAAIGGLLATGTTGDRQWRS